ncbi:MAG: hypothetical protein AAFX05_05845, partial [Planctomycetota bacterium]
PHSTRWTSPLHRVAASTSPGSSPGEVHGSPAASLLVVMWLRTIWLGSSAQITLVWDHVTSPGDDPGEVLAATLCSGLVQRVECGDPDAALALWGIADGAQEPMGDAVFDLFEGLADAWHARVHAQGGAAPEEWSIRMRGALEQCASKGHRRIALYGAGTHTRALGDVLREPPVEIICIIDDAADDTERFLWKYPIVSMNRARELAPDAVVISANSIEETLWRKCEPLRSAGLDVIRLYADASPVMDCESTAVLRIAPDTPRSSRWTHAPVLNLCALADGCRPFWSELGSALEASGSGLLHIASLLDGRDTLGLGVSGSLHDLADLGDRWPAAAPIGPPPEAACLERCLAFERSWRSAERHDLAALVERGMRAVDWLIDHAVDHLHPGLALVWNGDAGFSMVALRVLRRRGVPILFTERGAVAPSVVFDRVGIGGVSELTRDASWAEVLSAAPTDHEVEAGRALADHLRAHRRENRSGAVDAGATIPIGTTLALFPGVDASLDGLAPDACARRGSPLGTPIDGVEAMLRAARSPQRVIIKPHPRDPHAASYAALAAQFGAAYSERLGIHDALDAGLAIATSSDAIAWLAMASEAPALSLHVRSYSGRGALHDGHDPMLLPGALEATLRDHESGIDAVARERRLAMLWRYAHLRCFSADPALTSFGVRTMDDAQSLLLGELSPAKVVQPDVDGWFADLEHHGLMER